jgi:nudix-type nucleoside diphosphatase (YffH/AdpP family)
MSLSHPLFFYGTLRHRPLLEVVLGACSHLTLRNASLPGYAVRRVAEGPFPGICIENGALAQGLLVEGLTPDDVARLDYYEGGFDFSLISVTLEDGTLAQVYLPAPDAWTLQEPWDFDDWTRKWGQMTCHAAREVMGYMGNRTVEQIASMFPMIRARAWSRVNAASSRHGAETLQGEVQIKASSRVYAEYFALDEVKISHTRFDGGMTPTMLRAVFNAPDAVLVLPYDPVRDRVLLVEQLRMGPLARGDRTLWQLEPIAGRIDPGEAPQDTARREALEEASLTLGDLHPVAESYCSPGNSTEFFYIYAGIADLPDSVTGVGGLDAEHEDIRSHVLSFDALMQMCDRQEAGNAPLVLVAYWLARHRDRLRGKA